MTTWLSYRTAMWVSLLATVVFYAWVTVVPYGNTGAPIVAAVLFGLSMAIMKVKNENLEGWWEAADKHQTLPVLMLVVVGICVQIGAGWGLRQIDRFDGVMSTAIHLIVWGLLPLLCVMLGVVRWPKRIASPENRDFLTVAILSLLFAVGVAYLGSVAYAGPRATLAPVDVLITVIGTLLGATFEEIVFRVLLLTAILSASGSRMQAVVLSSTVFTLFHIPASISVPLLAGDWSEVVVYAKDILPYFVWTTGLGFFMGTLWIRTGSIALISIFHTILNLGQFLVAGLF